MDNPTPRKHWLDLRIEGAARSLYRSAQDPHVALSMSSWVVAAMRTRTTSFGDAPEDPSVPPRHRPAVETWMVGRLLIYRAVVFVRAAGDPVMA